MLQQTQDDASVLASLCWEELSDDIDPRCDREFMISAVTRNGRALKYATEGLRSDQELVTAAVTQNGRALQYADASLRQSREVVLFAVRQDGFALRFASRDLQQDAEIKQQAVLHRWGGAQSRIGALTNMC